VPRVRLPAKPRDANADRNPLFGLVAVNVAAPGLAVPMTVARHGKVDGAIAVFGVCLVYWLTDIGSSTCNSASFVRPRSGTPLLEAEIPRHATRVRVDSTPMSYGSPQLRQPEA
jgi:hypothetical protein